MKKLSYKIISVIIIIAFTLMLMMLCPWFYITKTEITGIESLTEQQILSELDLTDQKTNLLAFNRIKALNTLKNNPYVDSANIKKKLPNILQINITERKIRGYIPYMSKFLYIDSEGRVIDVQSAYVKQLPIVVGLSFRNFTIGEILPVENSSSFNAVVELSRLMTDYNMLEDVIRVDVSDPDDIHLYINNIDVLFGDFSDSTWKINALNEIIKEIPKDDKGFLDIRDSSKVPLFTYLT